MRSFSVIIPALDEAHNLTSLLPRLMSIKDKVNIEILVSIGDSLSKYDNCPRFDEVHFISNTQVGRATQMNKAARQAQGEILAFLHADVCPPADFFPNMIETIENGYKAGFFSYVFDKPSFLLGINASFTKKDSWFTGGGDQCLFIERTTFDALGGFNEEQILMEDYELFGRIKKQKIPYTIVQNDLVVSARKYQNNSYLKVNLINLLLIILFKLGCSPQHLLAINNTLKPN